MYSAICDILYSLCDWNNTFAKIEDGKKGAISFLSNPKYTHFLYDTESSIVLVNNDLVLEQPVKTTLIRVENAYECVAKLLQLYDNSILQLHQADPVFAENLHQLYRAVRYRRVAVLKDYRSLRSDSVSDRLVEPFQFLGQNEDVRCYEHSSGQCKTFKVERIGRVVMLDDVCWSHEDDHRTLHTDLFHFSDEQTQPLTLRLNALAKQLLLEEYPAAAAQLSADGDHWLLRTQVCSWKGVGRFVLGLPGAIEVVDCPEFLDYLRQQPHF